MKNHPFLRAGAILSIIVGGCSIFLSFFYMDIASNRHILFRYCASFTFFISLIVVILSAITSKRLKTKTYDEITKTFNFLYLSFTCAMAILTMSFLPLLDFNNDGFVITFIIFLLLSDFFAIFFTIYGMCKTLKVAKNDDYQTKLEKLKDLLDKNLINQEEYEEKRKEIISSL